MTNLHIARGIRCAFIEYPTRDAAEYAASQLHNVLNIKGRAINVKWAQQRAGKFDTAGCVHVLVLLFYSIFLAS